MNKITRRIFTTRKDLEDGSPEELTEPLIGKAQTNPEGWTAGAAVAVNFDFLEERKELQRAHRSGDALAHDGVVPGVPLRAAKESLVMALQRPQLEGNAGREAFAAATPVAHERVEIFAALLPLIPNGGEIVGDVGKANRKLARSGVRRQFGKPVDRSPAQ